MTELKEAAYSRLFAVTNGVQDVTLGGRAYVGVVVTSPKLGWKFIGLIPRAEIMAPVYTVLTRLLLVFGVCLFGIGIFVWLFVDRTTARPLKTVAGFLETISRGDYSRRLPNRTKDEVGQIFASLNSTAVTLEANLREITLKTSEAEEKARAAESASQQAAEALRQARRARAEGMLHAAEQLESAVAGISQASREIAAKTDGIRHGTDTQRERIHTTASAMEEMNATVLEVARSAGRAAEQGTGVRDKAQEGAQVVKESMAAMGATRQQAEALNADMAQLDEQARAIGNIMTVISDIADQTNLLALNAAIEAARAGDAGRGFAVVADEVRKLAEKTMHATQDVGASIQAVQKVAATNVAAMRSAVENLERASRLANASGEVLSHIVDGAVESAGQIQSIATAAEQQSATSEEISHAIEEINGITVQTASDVAESSSALRKLAEQTAQLVALVQELKRESEKD